MKAARIQRIISRLKMRHLVLLTQLNSHRTLRRAAESLSITSSSASKLLAEVELIVDSQVFVRSSTGLVPTPHGEALIRWAELMLSDLGAACAEMSAIDAGASGRIRLGVFPVATVAIVPRLVTILRAQIPNVLITLREGREDELLPALRKGELDFVVGRLIPDAIYPDLKHEYLLQESTAVVIGAHQSFFQSGDFNKNHLSELKWILPSLGSNLHNLVTSWLGKMGLPPPEVAIEATSLLSTVAILGRTNLISALPEPVSSFFVNSGHLRCLDVSLPSQSNPVVLMSRASQPDSKIKNAMTRALDTFRHNDSYYVELRAHD